MTRTITDQWGQGRETILRLLHDKHLDGIPANPAHVDLLLQRADQNLTTVLQVIPNLPVFRT